METEPLNLGIAILPDAKITAEAGRLRKRIANAVQLNPIYSLENLPHVTLYQGCFPADALAEVERAVAEAVDSTECFALRFKEDLYLAQISGNVFWNVERSQELLEFHLRMVEILNPLRRGLMLLRYRERLDDPETPQEHKEIIQQYGIRFIGKHFIPHITLAKLQCKTDFTAVSSIRPESRLPASFSTVVLGEIGFAGDMRRLLATFPIK